MEGFNSQLKAIISTIPLHVNGLSMRLLKWPRMYYHRRKSKSNTNKAPTILCNNCTGGVIYHDLGLRFNSPTVNTLFYSLDDFVLFVKKIKSIDVEQLYEVETKYQYPVMGLQIEGQEILIGLVHYGSFEEGKSKWIERFERIDFNNLYVLYEGLIDNKSAIKDFDSLPYRKLMVSEPDTNWSEQFPFYIGLPLYDQWYPGKMFDYKSVISLKRHLDDVDYIGFLNNEV